MNFRIISEYTPTGDQPQAIRELAEGIEAGAPHQTLLGVTGSGKTFTIANVVEKVQRPTLVLSHNKTLAAQLYGEFKAFFPENKVEYFVSYYDYYQPEAYLPVTDTYIEKDLSINDEIEKLRLSATSALLSGRKDVLVVSSVSCLYGIGNPDDFHSGVVSVVKGMSLSRNVFLRQLVDGLYSRNEIAFERGNFRVKGDTVEIFLAYADYACRIIFWGDEVEEIESFDPLHSSLIERLDQILIYPANIFITSKERTQQAIRQIQDDMVREAALFKEMGKHLEAKRIEERVSYDLEMIRELGYCPGIENYSRYFDGRPEGSKPFCLLDYFPNNFLMVIDESHVTIPQIRAMYGGDRSRKETLVDYGFRLQAAKDNRPLKFEEFEQMVRQTIYVSATPADYELQKSEGVVVEQVVRPTGLIDPAIEVRPSLNQIDNLLEEIRQRIDLKERVLVTTLTKRMAEELTKYLQNLRINCEYIHSDVETLDRIRIMENLRNGTFDVLVGVNLLREGLDLPEVSLVAILDADKEGFLRSERSLTQTAGRAARNLNGKVIMYADKITRSMQATLDSTDRRRMKQMTYNQEHGITPQAIRKERSSILGQFEPKAYVEPDQVETAADPVEKYMTPQAIQKSIEKNRKEMQKAAKELDFLAAAQYRDEIKRLENLLTSTSRT